MRDFCCKKVAFFEYFGLNLGLDFAFEKNLDCLVLD